MLLRQCALLLLLIIGCSPALASEWRKISPDDIKYFVDPKTDLDFRVRLINTAQKTIDLASYDLRADDDFSMPVLSSLREAAGRGVKIRVLASWFPNFVFDIQGRALEFLQTPPAPTPIQVSVFGGPDVLNGILKIGDGMHEKIMVVDEKIAVASGRGLGDQYLEWLDTTFVMKGPLVQDSSLVFEKVWDSIQKQKLGRPFIRWRWRVKALKKSYSILPKSQAEPKQIELSQNLLAWAKEPSGQASIQARALHHNFIEQLMAHFERPSTVDEQRRIEQIEDPILDAVIKKLETAKDVRLYMLSTMSHPKFKSALIQAAKRAGTKIRIFTNGETPIDMATSPWVVSLPDLDDYLSAGIEVYAFKRSPSRPWTFLHRKLAILDQTIFFGSHNLNLPSSIFNDELSFEMVEPKLASEMGALFDEDLRFNGELLDHDRIHTERISFLNQLTRKMLWPLIGCM